jgi:hypothetical protein
MTRTRTVTLGDERDRLSAELDDLADDLAAADDPPAKLWSEAQDLDQAGEAVAALAARHGDEATVTVRGLTAGEIARVEDHLDDSDGGAGASRIAYAAAGLEDAPFLDDDAVSLQARMEAIADEAVGVRVWIEELVDDVGSPDEGNWQPLAERLAATDTDT